MGNLAGSNPVIRTKETAVGQKILPRPRFCFLFVQMQTAGIPAALRGEASADLYALRLRLEEDLLHAERHEMIFVRIIGRVSLFPKTAEIKVIRADAHRFGYDKMMRPEQVAQA